MTFSSGDGDKDISKYKRILERDRIDMKSLRTLAWRGIPSMYRAVTWKLLLVHLVFLVHSRAISPRSAVGRLRSFSESEGSTWTTFPVCMMSQIASVLRRRWRHCTRSPWMFLAPHAARSSSEMRTSRMYISAVLMIVALKATALHLGKSPSRLWLCAGNKRPLHPLPGDLLERPLSW